MPVLRPDDRWTITLPDGTPLDITDDVQQYRVRYGAELRNDPKGPRLTPARGRLRVWDPDRRYDPTHFAAVIPTTAQLPITLTTNGGGTVLWAGLAAVGETIELRTGATITFDLTDAHQTTLTGRQSYQSLTGAHDSAALWGDALTAFGVPYLPPQITPAALGPVIHRGSPLAFAAEYGSYVGGWPYAAPAGELGAVAWATARGLPAPNAQVRALTDSIVRRRTEWVRTRGLLVALTLNTETVATLHSSAVTLNAGEDVEVEYAHFSAGDVTTIDWEAPSVSPGAGATVTETGRGPLTQTVRVAATVAGTYTVNFRGQTTGVAVSEIQRPIRPDAETQFAESRWEPPQWWTRDTFATGDTWLIGFGSTPPLSMSLSLSRWARSTVEQAAVASLIPGTVATVEVPEIRRLLVLGVEYEQRARAAPTVLVHGIAIEESVIGTDDRWDRGLWDDARWRETDALIIVQDEGVTISDRATAINLVGPGVEATIQGDTAILTVPGGALPTGTSAENALRWNATDSTWESYSAEDTWYYALTPTTDMQPIADVMVDALTNGFNRGVRGSNATHYNSAVGEVVLTKWNFPRYVIDGHDSWTADGDTDAVAAFSVRTVYSWIILPDDVSGTYIANRFWSVRPTSRSPVAPGTIANTPNFGEVNRVLLIDGVTYRVARARIEWQTGETNHNWTLDYSAMEDAPTAVWQTP